MPLAKRIHLTTPPSIQPLNLSVNTSSSSALVEDDSGTASSSPTNSLSNDVASTSLFSRNSLSLGDVLHRQSSPLQTNPVWDESVTEILLTVAKQRDTRVVKINILRTYLEEKLGVVEFLCLYRGFKSEPKLTFHGTPWEHYQRFLPVLFTLLALDNTSVWARRFSLSLSSVCFYQSRSSTISLCISNVSSRDNDTMKETLNKDTLLFHSP